MSQLILRSKMIKYPEKKRGMNIMSMGYGYESKIHGYFTTEVTVGFYLNKRCPQVFIQSLKFVK